MGSIPSDSLIKDLQQDAYIALVRAMYANPHPEDPMVVQNFLMQAAKLLAVADPLAIYQQEQANIELIRRGQRPQGGLLTQGFGTPGSLPSGPIGAPGGSRVRARPMGGGIRTPASGNMSRQASLARARSTRSTGVIDPDGFVGRRIWRYYPNEDPERPWVEGFITDWDKMTGLYSILYDPNTPAESTEDFDFETAAAADYVLGDFYDVSLWNGSHRVAQRPAPVSIAPAVATAPAKRRRSSIKLPGNAPFQPTWFETAIHEANLDDLNTMLSLLEQREIEVAAAIETADMALALGDDAEERFKLESQFFELCRQEEVLMEKLRQIREEQ